MKIGYKLFAEAFSPEDLVAQAVRAEEAAAESAHAMIRFGPLGWKVRSELPNPVNFEARAPIPRASSSSSPATWPSPCGP